eukprot:CAMPEP_0174871086 /NCGR_PEP_ID=MMETSP1114-20130205/70851_1 /TAXON_ID=312471 /ORGANISM="Neobodo designis, Strain CCAP 1951/1" /LENGTH=59 /DNA_ID=CAMNT_0016106361 /DNA_START=1 /DNA_END=177 /DNA_ORIENTATION=+
MDGVDCADDAVIDDPDFDWGDSDNDDAAGETAEAPRPRVVRSDPREYRAYLDALLNESP